MNRRDEICLSLRNRLREHMKETKLRFSPCSTGDLKSKFAASIVEAVSDILAELTGPTKELQVEKLSGGLEFFGGGLEHEGETLERLKEAGIWVDVASMIVSMCSNLTSQKSAILIEEMCSLAAQGFDDIEITSVKAQAAQGGDDAR